MERATKAARNDDAIFLSQPTTDIIRVVVDVGTWTRSIRKRKTMKPLGDSTSRLLNSPFSGHVGNAKNVRDVQMQQTLLRKSTPAKSIRSLLLQRIQGEDEDTLSSMLETPRALGKVPAPAAASTPIPNNCAPSVKG